MFQEDTSYRNSSSLGKNARNNFVKKVYSILSAQLLVTVCFVALNIYSRSFARFQAQYNWAFWTAFIISILSLVALFLGQISKTFPHNVAAMGVFTLAESYLVSYICAIYTPSSVLLATVATLAATLGLTFHAFTTKSDYTGFGSYLRGLMSSAVWIILSVSLVNAFFLRSPLVEVVIAGFFALVYSVYIIYDTQLIMGGKNQELQLDDYVLGATILYVDIIGLFLKLLRLLGKKKVDRSS